MKKSLILLILILFTSIIYAEDGYRLWLRYNLMDNKQLLDQYTKSISGLQIDGTTPTLNAAREELVNGLQGLLGKKIITQKEITNNSIVVGTPASSNIIASLSLKQQLQKAGKEGFIIATTQSNQKNIIAIAANTDAGVLYGVFHFLRLLQTQQSIQNLSVVSSPKIQLRVLNHWDNLNRTVERGYAGFSIWDWHKLPGYIDKRYIDYARANASIGINRNGAY